MASQGIPINEKRKAETTLSGDEKRAQVAPESGGILASALAGTIPKEETVVDQKQGP